ncbi:MAG: hypothetical protein JKP90_09955 [Desulfofustis sp. PB-SRB1]|nr:hypothetical protein [Desulfofustis sp. PB-SRB1]
MQNAFSSNLSVAQKILSYGISVICLRQNFSRASILKENSHFSRFPRLFNRLYQRLDITGKDVADGADAEGGVLAYFAG